ncbi:LysR family transcriptional regulator [Pseudopelagicola sp. nBUS_19]|uniref:LysR family transcriptional regulator n=1 Tax=unclassified Pseudopelagicola TaxID=2649563 RepID=UPI003EBD0D7F|nr:LysR family transcriptional regulator [Hyphomicrobiales bacterium]
MTLDLRHFRCFAAVAEELHFHRAAKRLGVAQPALSRTIKNLETELGITLLNRTNRRVELSEAGNSFLKGCIDILGRTDRIIEDARRIHQGNIGTLRIGYTDNAMNGRLPRLLKDFQSEEPDVALLLTRSVTSEQLAQLLDGTIDVGLATGVVTQSELASLRVQSERYVCLVYDGHPLASRKSVKIEELSDEPMVQGSKQHWQHFYSFVTPLFRNAGFEPKVVQEGPTTSDIQKLVACGIGIAVLTETVADGLPAGLIVIPIENAQDKLDTIAVWNTGISSIAKEKFLNFLRKTV